MEMGWKLAAILMVLGGFGTAYNLLVVRLERSTYHRYVNTALLVVVGTGFTLVGAALLIGIQNTLLVLACFAASGAPMFVGSYIRQVQRHQQDEIQARELLKKGGLNDKSQSERIQHES